MDPAPSGGLSDYQVLTSSIALLAMLISGAAFVLSVLAYRRGMTRVYETATASPIGNGVEKCVAVITYKSPHAIYLREIGLVGANGSTFLLDSRHIGSSPFPCSIASRDALITGINEYNTIKEHHLGGSVRKIYVHTKDGRYCKAAMKESPHATSIPAAAR